MLWFFVVVVANFCAKQPTHLVGSIKIKIAHLVLLAAVGSGWYVGTFFFHSPHSSLAQWWISFLFHGIWALRNIHFSLHDFRCRNPAPQPKACSTVALSIKRFIWISMDICVRENHLAWWQMQITKKTWIETQMKNTNFPFRQWMNRVDGNRNIVALFIIIIMYSTKIAAEFYCLCDLQDSHFAKRTNNNKNNENTNFVCSKSNGAPVSARSTLFIIRFGSCTHNIYYYCY